MRRIARISAALLVLTAAAAGCARGPRTQSAPQFAGLKGVQVRIISDLPDSAAAPRGLRVPQLREQLIARMERTRVPVIRDEGVPSGSGASLQLELASLPVGPDDYSVWARVSLAELVPFNRLSSRPLLVATWVRSGKARVRGGDTAALWREIDALAREFAEAYHEANPAPRAPAQGGSGR